MKKLIFISLLFGAISARAQVVDTAMHNVRSARCTPFLNNPLLDTIHVTHVGIMYAAIDFSQSPLNVLRVDWVFINDKLFVINKGSLILVGADYLGWYNAVDKVNYFFGYIRTHLLAANGSTFITYQ